MSFGKLYGNSLSTCTRRVLTVAHEVDADITLVPLDFAKGDHKAPSYLRLQPFGQMPAFEQADGFSVYESRAIARYIDAKKGGKLSHSHDLKKYALVEQWASVEVANFDPSASGITYELVFSKAYGKEPDLAKLAQHKEKLAKVLEVYDQHLATHTYLIGNELSLADLFHLPYGNFVFNVLFPDFLDKFPHVKKWFASLTDRPSWKKVSQ